MPNLLSPRAAGRSAPLRCRRTMPLAAAAGRPAPLTPRRAARLAAAAGLAAAALAPATASAAPPIPRLPLFQSTTFKVTVVASQKTTWTLAPSAQVADCQPLMRTSGSGSETVSFRTRTPLRVKAYRQGSVVTLAPMLVKGFPPEVVARIKRSARIRDEAVAGSCGEPGGVAERTGFDCGSRDRSLELALPMSRGKLSVHTEEGIVGPVRSPQHSTCPIYANPKVKTNGFTDVGAALPGSDLFNPRLGRHIVIGTKTFRTREPGVTGKTVVRWEVALTRVAPIKRR